MESCSVGHITGSHMTSIPSEHAIIISSLAQAFLFPKKHRSSCLDRTGNSEALSDASWQEGCKGSHITSARPPPPTNLSPTRFISPCQRRKAHPTESIIMRVWSYASILGLLTSKTSCVKMASHSQRWPIPHNKIDFQFDFFDLAPNSIEIVCLQACDCFTYNNVTDRHEKHLLPPHMSLSLYFGYQIRVLPPPAFQKKKKS